MVIAALTDCQNKLREKEVCSSIGNGIYKLSVKSTLKDLQRFRSLLYGNFKKYEHYKIK